MYQKLVSSRYLFDDNTLYNDPKQTTAFNRLALWSACLHLMW